MTAPARQILPAAADGTEEWRAQRYRGIGGSDAAHLHNGRKTRRALWREKTGVAEPEVISPELQALFDYGHSREPVLAAAFTERTGLKVRNTGTWQSKEHEYMLANPDRLIGRDGILEIKTTGAYTDDAKLWRDGLVPPHAWVQNHWYAAVTGRTVLWFIAEIDRVPYILGPYTADQDLIDDLIVEAADLWDLVTGEREPDEDDETPNAPTIVIDGSSIPTDPWDDLVTMLEDLVDRKAEAKAATDAVKALEADVQELIGPSEFVTTADGGTILATNRIGTRKSLDEAAVKAAGIDLDEFRVSKPNSKPTLSVKIKKENP